MVQISKGPENPLLIQHPTKELHSRMYQFNQILFHANKAFQLFSENEFPLSSMYLHTHARTPHPYIFIYVSLNATIRRMRCVVTQT
ncbi:hypothetical protein GDO86_015782 [Hymenochirus boettgeri]|uniref:Uncharacterized protein n=1 Tax=Hymenochirus boettgeri TaxID=247094 RepID=A0A8T2JZP7_9PIPI|nr:hypothetical protein GDO86_015782 [Hymenochirus boettgeri]